MFSIWKCETDMVHWASRFHFIFIFLLWPTDSSNSYSLYLCILGTKSSSYCFFMFTEHRKYSRKISSGSETGFLCVFVWPCVPISVIIQYLMYIRLNIIVQMRHERLLCWLLLSISLFHKIENSKQCQSTSSMEYHNNEFSKYMFSTYSTYMFLFIFNLN